jgi:hypothetical protein
VLALAALFAPAPAGASGADCTCTWTGACYDFLNPPFSPPEEDCPCPACVDGNRHTGARVLDGWNPDCWSSGRRSCFLKRHAVSWRITCSACVADTDCCRTPRPADCPHCAGDGTRKPWGEKELKSLATQSALEDEVFKEKTIVAFSPNFYVATDIPQVKVRVRSGGIRPTDGHEYAHVMLQRAEAALREFTALVGRPSLLQPVGIFLPKSENTAARLKERYFRSRTTPLIYAGYGDRSQSAIAGGFCLNGFCYSLQRGRGEDREMHQALRHYLCHVFITNWVGTIGENRTIPRWALEGSGHWFGKRPPHLRDCAVFCSGEAEGSAGSPRGWETDLRRRAGMDDLPPIEPILQKDSFGKLTYDDAVQSWGWFAAAMEHWRPQWVEVLIDLRKERSVHDAFRNRLGVTPEQFQRLWKDWLAGRRPGLALAKGERIEAPAPAAAERALDGAKDGKEVLARIRAAGPPRDAAVIEGLLGVCARLDGDLAREAAGEALARAASPEAQRAVWEKGLAHPHPSAKVYAARACLRLRLKDAIPSLRALLDHPAWLVRAEAAVAAGGLNDGASAPAIRALAADPSPKVRIAAMDAMRGIPEALGREAIGLAAANLEHPDWQVRVAACQCLAAVGTVDAIEPLVARMEKEAGRVRREIWHALRAITHDDLGADPANWRSWWTKEAEAARARGGFPPPKDPTDGGRYGVHVPTYYGIRLFSDRVGFVLDTSRSTHRRFTPDPKWRERLLEEGVETATILEIMQAQLGRAFRALDPRVRFSVVAFSDTVRLWKDGMQPASPENRSNAEGFVRGAAPAGATNLHGALRTMLALGDEDPYGPGFRDTPDTMTVLTDGAPTAGEITDSAVLLAWFAGLNRYSRVKTHVVVFGQLEVEESFLTALAQGSGGDFVQVLEFNPK